jgi:hypothetical protein
MYISFEVGLFLDESRVHTDKMLNVCAELEYPGAHVICGSRQSGSIECFATSRPRQQGGTVPFSAEFIFTQAPLQPNTSRTKMPAKPPTKKNTAPLPPPVELDHAIAKRNGQTFRCRRCQNLCPKAKCVNYGLCFTCVDDLFLYVTIQQHQLNPGKRCLMSDLVDMGVWPPAEHLINQKRKIHQCAHPGCTETATLFVFSDRPEQQRWHCNEHY